MLKYFITVLLFQLSIGYGQVTNYSVKSSNGLATIPFSIYNSNDGNLFISNSEINVDAGSSHVMKVKPNGDTLFIKSTDAANIYVTSNGKVLSNKYEYDIAIQNYIESYVTMRDRSFNTKWQIDLSSNFSGGGFSISPPIVESFMELNTNRFICTVNTYSSSSSSPKSNAFGAVIEFDSTGNIHSIYNSPVYGKWLIAAKINYKWISYSDTQLMIADSTINNTVPIRMAYLMPEISSVHYHNGKIYTASKNIQAGNRAMLSCIDTNLVVLWSKVIEPHDLTKSNYIKDILYSNNKLICQYQDDTLSYILNFDMAGNLLSARNILLKKQEWTTNMTLLNDSLYVLKNITNSSYNEALIKMDDIGNYECSSIASFTVNNYPLSFNTQQVSISPVSFTYSMSNVVFNANSYTITLGNECLMTSIKYSERQKFIDVYPNPSSEILNVKLNPDDYRDLNDKAIYNIKIIDVLGKDVFCCPPPEGVGGGGLISTINISSLEKGIYFLSVYQNKQLIGTKKVVKE